MCVCMCMYVCVHVCAFTSMHAAYFEKANYLSWTFTSYLFLLECRVYAKHSDVVHLMSREGVR